MLIVSEETARRVVGLDDALAAVEACYIALHRGQARLFPVVMGEGTDPGTRFGVKTGLDIHRRAPGLKVGSYWPANRAAGLPSHGSTTLLLDDATGFPRALVASTHLTALRTAAADASAVRRLSRPDAARLAILGAGHQAMSDLRAVAAVRPLSQVRVWSRSEAASEAFAAAASAQGFPARASGLEAAVREAELIVTATPSQAPLFPADWVAPGVHLSAMGADARGKQELDPALLERARLFADVVEQALTIGEFEAAATQGRIRAEDVTPLGAVIAGDAPGRTDPGEITVFDSSGMALQDIAIGLAALERAQAQGLAVQIAF